MVSWTKFILEQFITWYHTHQSLSSTNKLAFNEIFLHVKVDDSYTDRDIINSYKNELNQLVQRMGFDPTFLKIFSRYWRGFKSFHSRAYVRSGIAISYFVSISTNRCPIDRRHCFADVLFYVKSHNDVYAFVKLYDCLDRNIANSLSTISVPESLSNKLKKYFGFYHVDRCYYELISAANILNKVIDMKWSEKIHVFTEVSIDWEHD